MIRTTTAAFAMLAASAALGEGPPHVTARGAIASLAGDSIAVDTREGGKMQVHLGAKTFVAVVTQASRADLKPDAYIGVAAAPGPDGEMKALEVHVFAPAMRGVGAGSRPFDLAPGSSMTNGALALKVGGLENGELTVVYPGGSQVIRLPPEAPIVAIAPGARDDLKLGAGVVASGVTGEGGAIDAAFVVVGKDGVLPPM